MRVYEFTEYRPALAALLNQWRADAPARTLSRIATAAGLQLSYLSNALRLRAHLSTDQVYAIANAIDLGAEATDYLLLVLEHERSGIPKRRQELERRIHEIRTRELRTEKQLKVKSTELSPENLERYYLDPFIQLAHIDLGRREGTSLSQVAREFGLSDEHASRVLKTLVDLKLAHKKNDAYFPLKGGHHLPKDSPVATPHLMLMRMKSIDQLARLTENERYCFSVTLSSSPETREQLEQEFIRFLKSAEALVKASKPELLYQMNFDLFPWRIQEGPPTRRRG